MTLKAANQDRPDKVQERRHIRVWQLLMYAGRLVLLDETGTATNMTHHYDRAPRGRRVTNAVPHGDWLTTIFLAGLRENGIITLLRAGPMPGEIFKAYVEQMLASALSPDDGSCSPIWPLTR